MSLTPEEARLRARNLRTLGLLAGLFLVPLALAFFTYYGSSWRPLHTVNHGTLITPPVPLPTLALPEVVPEVPGTAGSAQLQGRWTLVYLGPGDCGGECAQALFVMRSARLALNKDIGRVAQLLLVTGNCCARAALAHDYPGVRVLDATNAAAATLLADFPGSPEERAHTLYVVDPLGNLMMRYDARQNSRGLLEDLQKLLRLSHIG
ncbi:MAG: hypothetical protein JSS29_11555 [Proteobacteria bacterium]|nr:hypothetical protein [Pseudomonadota bacterium]